MTVHEAMTDADRAWLATRCPRCGAESYGVCGNCLAAEQRYSDLLPHMRWDYYQDGSICGAHMTRRVFRLIPWGYRNKPTGTLAALVLTPDRTRMVQVVYTCSHFIHEYQRCDQCGESAPQFIGEAP